jgi:hypothetical protein
MNPFHKTFTTHLAATLVVVASTPAAATSHYRLWAWDGRYGGWGWSKPVGIFGGPWFGIPEGAFGGPHGCEYWYPAYSYAYYPYGYAGCGRGCGC